MKRFFSFILAMTFVSLSSFAGDLLTAAMFHEWSSSGADATVTSEATYCEYLINDAAASGGTVYGNGNVTAKTFADVTEYAKLVLTFTEGTPRLLFNRSEDTSSDFIEIKAADSPYVTVGDDGSWTIDITKINAERGFAHLLCIKGANWANVTITKAELFKLTFDGDYYLYNVEAQAWLGGGNSWGTQASIIKHPSLFGIAPVDGGEGYTIDSYTYNNANDHFLARDAQDTGFYVDAPASTWTIEATTGGYYLKNAAGQYAAYDGTTVLAVETVPTLNAVWQIFTKADLTAKFASATKDTPVDATFLLPVADFSRNQAIGWESAKVSPWQVSADCTNKNLSGGNNLNNCAESWHSTFDIYQELTNVPNGWYKIDLQGFYRQDGSDNDNLPYFYANDAKSYISLKTGEENSMSDASASFTNGLYKQETITIEVTDGNLRIGVKNEANATLWVIWDNFEITYYGTEPIAKYIELSIPITSTVGKTYEGFTYNASTELDVIASTIGCSIDKAVISAVLPDGTYDTNYQLGTTDGWRAADGSWLSWGNSATRFCVKADFTAEDPGFYYIGGYHEGEHLTTPVTYVAKYSFKNGASEGILSLELVYQPAPEPEVEPAPYPYTFDENGSQILAVTRTSGLGYDVQTLTYDAAAVCTALGIEKIGDATLYGLNASYGWTVGNDVEWIKNAMDTYDGWRDLNGDFCTWGSGNAAVYVKAYLEDKDNIVLGAYPGQEPSVNGPAYNAYWVIAANNKAVLIDTQITFVAAESDNATAITGVESSVSAAKIYDLTGRKVNALKPGQIYIINGKKVMMK